MQGWSLPEWSPSQGLETKSKLLALLANIRFGWKSLAVLNTLAYYGTELITAVIFYRTRVNVIKLFTDVSNEFSK